MANKYLPSNLLVALFSTGHNRHKKNPNSGLCHHSFCPTPTRFAELLLLFSYSKVLALSDGEVLCMGTRIAELLNLELTS